MHLSFAVRTVKCTHVLKWVNFLLTLVSVRLVFVWEIHRGVSAFDIMHSGLPRLGLIPLDSKHRTRQPNMFFAVFISAGTGASIQHIATMLWMSILYNGCIEARRCVCLQLHSCSQSVIVYVGFFLCVLCIKHLRCITELQSLCHPLTHL